jgi:hypothetical protein
MEQQNTGVFSSHVFMFFFGAADFMKIMIDRITDAYYVLINQ